jgi:hypothetical protein
MQQFKRDIFFLLQIQKNWGRKKNICISCHVDGLSND